MANCAVESGYKYKLIFDGTMKIIDISNFDNYSRSQMYLDRNQLYVSLEEAIKSLDSYGKKTILPDGRIIKPVEINYPNEYAGVLKPWNFGTEEYIRSED